MKLDPGQRGVLLRDPAGWIACGFGSGLSPRAPGTAGSLAALLPWFALRELPWAWYLAAVALAFALGVRVCARVVAKLRIADPGFVVWDEFVGQWIALLPLLWLPFAWWQLVAGFALFRIFDIVKPWPVSWADHNVGGGLGVMLDDVIAGLYAALVLAVLQGLAAAWGLS
ncbi:MAG: phosphatidylglycerophosphatase A [Proteobacteria bacterium]|uniref:phosphatidylglycerophosphatase A n=1 Tax=Rudaea sp. TaxID=2136325 RepID=UPI001DD0C01D|nr:phosphatidylglycerophosphatase A [Pseudomonadota bacterium]MBS0565851.1 phosphatidylglycerophosphatase A [Pseudomonadota bacterium]